MTKPCIVESFNSEYTELNVFYKLSSGLSSFSLLSYIQSPNCGYKVTFELF